MAFAKDFVWGAAAASYQVEGGAFEDGKGLSTWDVMCRKPGAIRDGNTGEVACDHYHRYKEDVSLMKQIGLKAYRLSISWPRVLPEGIGTTNSKGMAFYDKLIDELVANNIEPYVTLFHWDFPYELYCRGGWLNPNSSDWFAEYVGVVVERLSDRVKNWITFNEPQCFLGLGHFEGIDAPGLKLPVSELLLAGHNMFLAHGKAVQAIRAKSKQKCRVGYAPVGIVKIPVTETQADIEAAKKVMFSVEQKNYDNNTWWMDPVYFGRYPEDGLQLFGTDMPKFAAKDLETISQPLDFFGVNIYHGQATQMNDQGKPEKVSMPLGHGLTMMNWAVTPDSLYWGSKFFYERYKKPIFITENGMANTDWVALDGKVHDPQRIDFLHRYLLSLRRAEDEGIDVGGYFLWSIMDNFEWSSGFSKRFGIIYVDYATQQRIFKDSAYWYRDVIASNGELLDDKACIT